MTRRRDIRIDGDKVRQLRTDRGMTLAELADRTGLSVTFLSYLERGHRQTTTLASTVRLAAALQVATEEVAT